MNGVVAALIGGIVAAAVAGFQCALALGAPGGAYAWGGGHEGRLPTRLRGASAASAVVLALISWFFLATAFGWPSLLSASMRTVVAWLLTALFAVGTVLNALSRSRSERLLWTPVAAVLCGCSLATALTP